MKSFMEFFKGGSVKFDDFKKKMDTEMKRLGHSDELKVDKSKYGSDEEGYEQAVAKKYYAVGKKYLNDVKDKDIVKAVNNFYK